MLQNEDKTTLICSGHENIILYHYICCIFQILISASVCLIAVPSEVNVTRTNSKMEAVL